MTIENIISEFGLTVFAGAGKEKTEISGAYASDLLSDVMGRARTGEVWITMQTHKNILAVASLKELAAILIVNGGKPEADTIETAEKEGIIVLGTAEKAFHMCGKLYKIMEKNAMV
jgi:hypothetical protein